MSVLTSDRFQQRTAAKGARLKDNQDYALGLIEYLSAAAPSVRFRAGGPRWLSRGPRWLAIQPDWE